MSRLAPAVNPSRPSATAPRAAESMRIATPSSVGRTIAASVIQRAIRKRRVLVAGCSIHSRSKTTTAKPASHSSSVISNTIANGALRAGTKAATVVPNSSSRKNTASEPALTNAPAAPKPASRLSFMRSGQERIGAPLTANGGVRAVTAVDDRVVGQGHQLRVDAVEQRLRVRVVEV